MARPVSPSFMLNFARLSILAGLAWSAAAQPAVEPPEFEVASVKIHQPPEVITEGSNRESIDSVPGSLTMRNINLRAAISWAYSLKDYQISGPDWLNTVAKSGPKLHAADPGGNTDMRGENGSFVFHHTSMEQFADDLASLRQVDRPVLDRTSIEGAFDFNLKLGDNNNEMKRLLINGEGASLFTLIQEQLGLRIEAGKGAVEMLTIDHAERIPTEN
jgi:hypothetical protein